MTSLIVESCIHGYHVYKDIWNAPIGQVLVCEVELGNLHDPHAVAVISNDTIVGHVPRTISAVCHFFLRRNGNILCQVTGRRHRSEDLVQGGLEVPCTLTFTGDAKEIAKAERLLKIAPIRVESLSKKFKVDLDDTCTSSDENDVIGNAIWLKVDGYCMVQQDKIMLEEEQLLNDNHINFAQKLLLVVTML